MENEQGFPVIRQTVLDTTDPRRLAEFYRQLFGLRYRAGDEPPAAGQPDPAGQDWLILMSPGGGVVLGFQKVQELPQATWPDGPVPQQLHLDTTVPTKADLDVQHERALALGARLLQDRSDDPEEPLRVYADPAGHPFCIFVAAALTRELSHCPFGIMNLNFYRTGRGSPRPYRGAPRWGAGAGVVRWSHANGRCLPFPARRP